MTRSARSAWIGICEFLHFLQTCCRWPAFQQPRSMRFKPFSQNFSECATHVHIHAFDSTRRRVVLVWQEYELFGRWRSGRLPSAWTREQSEAQEVHVDGRCISPLMLAKIYFHALFDRGFLRTSRFETSVFSYFYGSCRLATAKTFRVDARKFQTAQFAPELGTFPCPSSVSRRSALAKVWCGLPSSERTGLHRPLRRASRRAPREDRTAGLLSLRGWHLLMAAHDSGGGTDRHQISEETFGNHADPMIFH